MAARGKPHQKITVACAHELAGFVWAIVTNRSGPSNHPSPGAADAPPARSSRVKLDGTYGKPGHHGQRYKCSPKTGKPHVFTELLSREESWHGACEHCEWQVERREGPKAPRHYQFVARGIAEVRRSVGAGDSYMQASRVARDRARRFRRERLRLLCLWSAAAAGREPPGM